MTLACGPTDSPRSEGRRRVAPALVALLSIAAAAAPGHVRAGSKWASIPPADAAQSQSSVEPGADAEILLRTIYVEDEINGPAIHTVVRHEVREKVFTPKGAEDASHVEIEHDAGVHIEGLAARTVHPDGSIVELSKDQVFDRTSVKGSGINVAVKAFAFPAVTPGSILEYRWSEIRYEDDAGYVVLDFQNDVPSRETRLFLKPLPIGGTGFNFKMRTFNMQTPHFEDVVGGYHRAVLPPIPGRRDEPYMPPRRQVDPWAILYYTEGDDPTPEALWKNYAADVLKTREDALTPNGAVRDSALQIAAAGTTARGKADLLDDWIRTRLEYVTDDRLALSETERGKLPKNKTPGETLARRRGTTDDLVYLFIAMCRAAGLTARLAAVGDRSKVFFDSRLGIPNLLDNYCAAVATEQGWRFYDPSERWLGPGHLAWYMEGEEALVLDKEKPEFAKTPIAPPESTMCRRSAHIRLEADGTAVGAIRAEYSGHMGARVHEDYDALAPEGRVEHFRSDTPMSTKDAVFADVQIEDALNPAANVIERAEVRVPGYAQSAGDRILVPLSFFQWKGAPMFPDSRRRYPVYFSYPWAVSDTVTIEIPDGYEVEVVPAPEPLVARGVGGYQSMAMISTDGRTVRFFRDFTFGAGDAIFFPADQYGGLKAFFDGFAQRDDVTLSLRRVQ